MNWINVKKQKPKLDQAVMICQQGLTGHKPPKIWYRYEFATFIISRFDNRKHVFAATKDIKLHSSFPYEFNSVTHWMPLPKKPIKDDTIILMTHKQIKEKEMQQDKNFRKKLNQITGG